MSNSDNRLVPAIVRYALVCLLSLVRPCPGCCQPIRVLFIGNCLTLYNDQMGMIEAMASAAGQNLSTDGKCLEEQTNLLMHSQRQETLDRISGMMNEFGANSVQTAVLLHKRREHSVKLRPTFVAFEIPDEFVVGYGLDYLDMYRNLPYLAILEPAEIEATATEAKP